MIPRERGQVIFPIRGKVFPFFIRLPYEFGFQYLSDMDRCPWSESDDLYRRYHDEEWGRPVRDEKKHFEFLLLETMQAGLSWRTILRKRENYRTAFDGFDFQRIAEYGGAKIERLMRDTGIIRNRRKLEGAVRNARSFLEVQIEFGSFDSYIWSWTGGRPLVNRWTDLRQIPVSTELSDRLSADMKKRGFSYIGSVTIYSHLQAIGVVNDHLVSCFCWKELTGNAVKT